MTIEIRVPTLGESVTEATVARWLKQPGETITRDEPVVELETDKVTLEVPAPAAGTLGEIRAGEGTNVPVGAEVGIITDGAAGSEPGALAHNADRESARLNSSHVRMSHPVFCGERKREGETTRDPSGAA